MAASGMPPPPQENMRSTNNRHIPAEIVEEILLNLPVKSLRRFSSVSKSWNSTIFSSDFVKRYRGHHRRAALERIALMRGCATFPEKASSCLISSLSSNNPTVAASAADFFFLYVDRHSVVASCGDLWLSRVGDSLSLWNPSTRSFKKLPKPSFMQNYQIGFFVGLGYESVGDDYKILRFPWRLDLNYEAELYSLRSDSWKSVEYLPKSMRFVCNKCVFVSGNLHWMFRPIDSLHYYEGGVEYLFQATIICFDLLTEKFGEVALPANCTPTRRSGLCVLRGMLCVSVNRQEFCEVWVMEEYGAAHSWTKMINIVYFKTVVRGIMFNLHSVTPLYVYEDGAILVKGCDGGSMRRMFVYRDEKTTPREVHISSCDGLSITHGLVYVDSLVAPATWSSGGMGTKLAAP